MSEETFETARAYARKLVDNRPSAADKTRVIALRGRTNGFEQHDSRAELYQGHGVETVDYYGGAVLVIFPNGEIKGAEDAAYLIDDGRSAHLMYVAGFSASEGYVILNAVPLDVNEDGSPRLRADDQRPVDMSTWMLAPRRMYHFKARRDIPALEGAQF